MTNLYCISGKAGSGKDTVGEHLSRLTNRPTYALADPIKELVKALFGLTDKQINSRKSKETTRFMEVLPYNLEDASIVYNSFGLHKYQDFHDAWASWINLLNLRFEEQVGTYEQWISPRTCFQTIGTEWGRALDNEIWLDIAPENAIITDIRMDNEAQYFLDKGYILLEVERTSQTEITNSKHSTEAGICRRKFMPHVVYNNTTIPELYQYLETEL